MVIDTYKIIVLKASAQAQIKSRAQQIALSAPHAFNLQEFVMCIKKKHMNDVLELAEMKRRANTRSLKEMALLLRGGSKLIWIAASGGRDRPDPITNQWSPVPFDASAVDNMRSASELLQIWKWFDYSGLLRF
ncbi:putative glycerol-3-phosphate 1-O-acyltransferase [Helianthus annuus]|uniref:Glycerol-3-phosphate 1-O-acyltransferase n=3 Tax=Helianthus annuus TaxID=4232 RepID=A0A9K3IER7_HELAN|nr:putative glycerol-3-phosphate 1-O-acyltransferase [Helianthus annuus]